MCLRVQVHKNSMELPCGNAAYVLRTLPDACEIGNELFYLMDIKTDQKKKTLQRELRDFICKCFSLQCFILSFVTAVLKLGI